MASPRMIVQVSCYGGLRTVCGAAPFPVELPESESTAEGVRRAVAGLYPALAGALRGVAVARGEEVLDAGAAIRAGDELALLPPVSGGSDARWLTEEPLDLEALLAETADDGAGALVVFGGTVRNENDGRPVDGMTYEAHAPVAVARLRSVESRARERFAVSSVRVRHRMGALALGEASVYVVVRAPHRGEAFRAAEWAIDTLKKEVAIWKREHYTGGGERYLEGTPLAPDPKE